MDVETTVNHEIQCVCVCVHTRAHECVCMYAHAVTQLLYHYIQKQYYCTIHMCMNVLLERIHYSVDLCGYIESYFIYRISRSHFFSSLINITIATNQY